jgi:hypothetical protein
VIAGPKGHQLFLAQGLVNFLKHINHFVFLWFFK